MQEERTGAYLHIYAEGRNPSGRDVQNLCSMIETCVAMSVIEHACAADKSGSSRYTIGREYEDYLRMKYFEFSKPLKTSIEMLTTLVFAATLRTPSQDPGLLKDSQSSRDAMDFYERTMRRLRHEFLEAAAAETELDKTIGLSNSPRLSDVNEWIALKYGNQLLETKSIQTTNSIELLFNVIAVGSILGFQHIPEIKDMAIYTDQVFRDWMGKSKRTSNTTFKIPSLPPSMERTLAQFKEVELTQNSEGWSLKLKR